jgi:DNA repair exonuclease SbcCD ATPase subunit
MPPRRITPIAVNPPAANSNSNSLGPNNRNNATKKHHENMAKAVKNGNGSLFSLAEAMRQARERQRERNNAIYKKYEKKAKKAKKAKKKEKVVEWNNLNEPNKEMKNEARKLGVKLTKSYKINGKKVREEIPRGKLRKKIKKAKKRLKKKAEAKEKAVKAKANAKEKEAKAKANAKAAKAKAKENAKAAKAKMPNLKKRAKALKVKLIKPSNLPNKKFVYKSVNELEKNITNAEKAKVREERRKRFEQRKKNEQAAVKARAKARRDYEKLESTKLARRANRSFFLKNKPKPAERSKKVRKAARNNFGAVRRGAASKKKGIPQALKNEAKRLGIKLTYTRPGSSSGTYLSVKQIQAKINAKKGGAAGAKNNNAKAKANAARQIQWYRNQRNKLRREYEQILNAEERRLRKQLANINSNSNSNALVPHFIRRRAAANANARVAQILNNNTATNYSSSNSNNNYRVNRSPAVKPSMVKKSSGGRFTSARMQQLARNARRPRWV